MSRKYSETERNSLLDYDLELQSKDEFEFQKEQFKERQFQEREKLKQNIEQNTKKNIKKDIKKNIKRGKERRTKDKKQRGKHKRLLELRRGVHSAPTLLDWDPDYSEVQKSLATPARIHKRSPYPPDLTPSSTPSPSPLPSLSPTPSTSSYPPPTPPRPTIPAPRTSLRGGHKKLLKVYKCRSAPTPRCTRVQRNTDVTSYIANTDLFLFAGVFVAVVFFLDAVITTYTDYLDSEWSD